MKFQELRHLDGLKGYLSILDGKVLGSHAYGLENGLLHAVASTVKVFVEQQSNTSLKPYGTRQSQLDKE